MTKTQKAFLLAIAIVNAAMLILFMLPLLLESFNVDLAVRMNFTQLDRAGVINQQALKAFDQSYKFDNSNALEYRTTVPMYIAGPAIAQMQFMARVGMAVTGLTSLTMLTLWIWVRRREYSGGNILVANMAQTTNVL